MKATKQQLIKTMTTPSEHHIFSPSGSAQWLACGMSIWEQYGLPDTTSPAAQEGTTAHELAEKVLKSGDKHPIDFSDQYPAEMVEEITKYVDYVDNQVHGGKIFVEVRLNLERWIQGAKGTADIVGHYDNTLHIIDLKYGKGVKVSAIDNSQLKLYALSAYHAMREAGFQIEKVMLHIAQPRLDHFEAWEFPLDEIPVFGDQVSTWVNLCLDKQVDYNPSEKACQWCKAKATCNALYEHNTALVSQDFDDLTPPAPESLSQEQLKKIIDNKPLIESWLKSIEAHIFSKLEHGESFPGYKMVEGRSIRKYNDKAEKVLSEMLGDKAYDKKLIGITQAEKLIGKKHFAELNITEKPPGKPTLAPESDKRKALPKISDDFENLD